MQSGITLKEVNDSAKMAASSMNLPVEVVIEQMYNELKTDIDKGKSERQSTNFGDVTIMGGSAGNYRLDPGNKGDVYYTDAYSGALDIDVNHGHVGLYNTSTQIVESVPSSGVRTISITNRRVHVNAVQENVSTNSTNKANATGWAMGRVGVDGYSYNFATNRLTSHTGDKNCSKLVWSAYKQYGNLDIDKDKGFGVYPRDIRDSPLTLTYKVIK